MPKAKARGAHVAPLRRTGLHRLGCPHGCETFAYLTVAAIERGRLPLCPDCTGRLIPNHPDLASLVLGDDEWDQHPWLPMLAERAADAEKGQRPQYRDRANRKPGAKPLRDPWQVAWEGTSDREGVAELMRAESRARQLACLVQNQRTPEPLPF